MVEQRRHRGPIDWLFRNRATGRITIGQFPNAALALFLVATVLQWLLDPTGTLRTGLRALAAVGLLWWAVDEADPRRQSLATPPSAELYSPKQIVQYIR